MGIDLGSAFTIGGVSGVQADSPALKIAGTSDAFVIDLTGRTFYPNQIGFIAGFNIDNGWTALAPDAWNLQNFFNNVTYNKGGGYNAGRFTAPVSGSYLLHWAGYQYKADALQGHYVHTHFFVNGGSIGSAFRMKGYFAPTGYAFHGEIVDIYYLNAGDYVDMQIYSGANGKNISLYRYYCLFSGMLVG
jgi:hypothetical protein